MIEGREALETVIRSCQVCRLAIHDEIYPYIVPLNFGYRDGILYFHGAMKGKKLTLLEKDNHAAFEMDTRLRVAEAAEACDWSMIFQSITGHGRVTMIESPDEKRKALAVIMAQYSDAEFTFPEKQIRGTAVYQLAIEEMTGKQSGMTSA